MPEESKKPPQFPVGSTVHLVGHGPVGVVLGSRRGKTRVRWPTYTGSHRPGLLVRVQESDRDEPAKVIPDAPRRNPYARLLAKLDASKNDEQVK
jgi:hypothetical protein